MRFLLVVLLGLAMAACGGPRVLERDLSPPVDYVISNVSVLDIQTGRVTPDQFVVVSAGRIERVSGTPPESLTDVAQIDAAGAVMLPGLIDMHVHVFDEAELAANLAYGVTTIRNLGGMPFHLPMARQIESGRLLGPRLITTGAILNERDGRNQNELQTLVGGGAQARAAVQRQHAAGYRHLKLYSNLSRESLAAIVDEAARLGMSVSGHPVEGTEADPLTFQATLDAGFVTIEHVESIVWHALQDDPDTARAAALAQQMGDAGAVVSPTLIVHQNLARIVETRGAHVTRPDMVSFSPVMEYFERETYAFWAGYDHDDRSRMQAFYVELTGLMHAAGVELVVGTDAGVMVTPHGVSVSEEIALLVSAGLTPLEALQAATLNPARALGLGTEIGQIAPGFAADFLLVPSDPQADLSVLRQPVGVMRDGVWLDADRLAALRDGSARPSEIRTWRRVIHHVATR